jgi:hypothetical protein
MQLTDPTILLYKKMERELLNTENSTKKPMSTGLLASTKKRETNEDVDINQPSYRVMQYMSQIKKLREENKNGDA